MEAPSVFCIRSRTFPDLANSIGNESAERHFTPIRRESKIAGALITKFGSCVHVWCRANSVLAPADDRQHTIKPRVVSTLTSSVQIFFDYIIYDRSLKTDTFLTDFNLESIINTFLCNTIQKAWLVLSSIFETNSLNALNLKNRRLLLNGEK